METVQLLKRVHVRNMFINVAEYEFEPVSKGGLRTFQMSVEGTLRR